MWAWLITLLKGFLPIDGKRIGKITWVLVLSAISAVLVIGVYNKITQKNTNIEKIETQIINQCPDENKIIGLRFNLWKLSVKLGL